MPGLYVAGPPGAGKSSALYFMAARLRRQGHLVVYLPSWERKPNKTYTMGTVLNAFRIASRHLKPEQQELVTKEVFLFGEEKDWSKCMDQTKLAQTHYLFEVLC